MVEQWREENSLPFSASYPSPTTESTAEGAALSERSFRPPTHPSPRPTSYRWRPPATTGGVKGEGGSRLSTSSSYAALLNSEGSSYSHPHLTHTSPSSPCLLLTGSIAGSTTGGLSRRGLTLSASSRTLRGSIGNSEEISSAHSTTSTIHIFPETDGGPLPALNSPPRHESHRSSSKPLPSSQRKSQNFVLFLYTVGLLFSSVGNSIFFKKMTDSMPNYSWFISQITTAAYVPVFGFIVLFATCRGAITKEMRRFPKSRFLIMGSLDACASILIVVGGAFTAGSTQVVLQQVLIPTTLVLTYLILKTRYHCLQQWGAAVIIAGVMVVKMPDLLHPPAGQQDVLLFNLIFLSGTIPNTFSQVYKEVAFRDAELDVNFMQFWVAVFQVICGFCLVPFTTLSFLGPQRIEFKAIPSMVLGGSKCLFLRENTIVHNCGLPGQRLCDDCSYSWAAVTTYISFNVAYNCFTLLVVKHGGAALSFLVATLRLPLTSFAFYSHTIMGANAVKPKVTDFIGLIVLLSGLCLYRYGGILRRKAKSSESPPYTTQVYFFVPFLSSEPNFVRIHTFRQSPEQLRSTLYWKLAVASPHQSPHLRDRWMLRRRKITTDLSPYYILEDEDDEEFGKTDDDATPCANGVVPLSHSRTQRVDPAALLDSMDDPLGDPPYPSRLRRISARPLRSASGAPFPFSYPPHGTSSTPP